MSFAFNNKQNALFLVIANEATSLVTLRRELLLDLRKHGYVVAMAANADADVRQKLLSWGIAFQELPISRAGLSPIADLRTWRILVHHLRRLRPTAVLACTAKPVVYGLWAAAWCGVPRRVAMFTGLGFAFTPGGGIRRHIARWVQCILARLALRHAHWVIFQNHDDREEFNRRGLLPHRNCIVIAGSGVDLQRFAMLPLSAATPVFLLIARLLRDKGVAEFAAASRMLRERGAHVRCLIAGPLDKENPSGISPEELESWLKNGLLEWLGPLSEVGPALAQASVFVLPSVYREGIPRAILEAMSSGRAIITTDAPGCRETVIPGVNGFLIPPRDAAALCEAMFHYVQNPQSVMIHGAASRCLAVQRFDVRRVNANILAALLLNKIKADHHSHAQAINDITTLYNTKSQHLVIIANQAGSALNFRASFIRFACSQGHRVTVLVPEHTLTREHLAGFTALGASVRTYQLRRASLLPWYDMMSIIRLLCLVRQLSPHAILSYSIKPVIFGTLVGWLNKVPKRVALIEGLGFVFTDHATRISASRKALRVLVWLLYRLALRHAYAVGFLNKDDRQEFLQRNIVAPRQALLMGAIGVDLASWQALPPCCDPVTFTCIARLLRDKGIYEFVAAARCLRARNAKPLRFLLLGDTDENPASVKRHEIQSWVAEGLIEAPGHVAVRPWLAQTSVFVLPSYYREGVPRSTQEAMACAKPVITTDVPGCRETVIHGLNGFLVPPRDVQALASAMQRFIDEPELIARMGHWSRMIAERRFDCRRFDQRLLALLVGGHMWQSTNISPNKKELSEAGAEGH